VQTKGADGKPMELEVEGNSIATMARRGWTKESLKVGDQVVVKGNPDRNPNRRFVYLNSMTKAGGAAIGGAFRQATNATAGGSKDFTGVWRPTAGPGGAGGAGGRSVLLSSPQPSNFAVTAKGKASYAKFNGEADPRNDCVPESLPAAISTTPYLFQIERRNNGDYEIINENYAARRVIHMSEKAPPAGTKRDYDGYSVGRMEGNVLVVDTTLFSPQPWGNDAGLDSGEQKRIVERYSMEDEGKTLVISYTQTDPEYLAQPVNRTLRWQLQAQDKLQTEWSDCDPEAGRRHIAKEQ
jgi:hypothetical protein